jgi:WD40 repeat protein
MAQLDATKVKSRTSFNHPATFYSLCADLAAGRLYAGSEDYAIHVYDPAFPKKEAIARWAKHDNYVSALVFVHRPTRPWVVSGSYDRHLIWWDPAGGQPVRIVEAHRGWIRDLALTPDGNHLVSAGDDMLVKVWETETARLVRTLDGHEKRTPQGHVTALYAVAVSPDGKHLASGDRIGDVRVWELDTGKLVQRLQTPVLYTYDPRQRKRSIGGIRSLAFSPDSGLLAVGGIGQIENVDGLAGPAHVDVWDWRKPLQRFAANVQGHKGIVNDLLFYPGGSWLLGAGGGSDNGFLAFWKTDAQKDQKDPVPVQRIKTDGHIHRFCLNPGKNELYTAGFHKVEVWSLGG